MPCSITSIHRPQTYDGYFHTQDSPFKYMELSIKCGVLSNCHKLMTNTQHSSLRIHSPHSGFLHSNTLSVEC